MKKSDILKVLKNKIEVAEWWFEKGDFEESNRWVVRAYHYIEKVNVEHNRLTHKSFDRLSKLSYQLEMRGF